MEIKVKLKPRVMFIIDTWYCGIIGEPELYPYFGLGSTPELAYKCWKNMNEV